MIIAGSIRVIANGLISSFFMAEKYSTVLMYHILFLHYSVDGHLGCFHVQAILNSAAVSIGGACIFSNYGFLRCICPQVGCWIVCDLLCYISLRFYNVVIQYVYRLYSI